MTDVEPKKDKKEKKEAKEPEPKKKKRKAKRTGWNKIDGTEMAMADSEKKETPSSAAEAAASAMTGSSTGGGGVDKSAGDEGGEGGHVPLSFQMVDFPIRSNKDNNNQDVEGYVEDNEDEYTNTSSMDFSPLHLIKEAAIAKVYAQDLLTLGSKGGKIQWASPENVKHDMDGLMVRIGTKGAITRVVLVTSVHDYPAGFYILMPPDEQDQILYKQIMQSSGGGQAHLPKSEKNDATDRGWLRDFPPRGGRLAWNSAYISHFYVHPSFQGFGIGGQMMDDLLQQCTDTMTASQIEVNTDLNNAAGQDFFKHYDFRPISVQDDHVRWSKTLPDRSSLLPVSSSTPTAETQPKEKKPE